MEIKGNEVTTLRDLLHIVFKRKIHLLGFMGITLCAGILFTLTMKPSYEATSQILLKIGRENLYVPELPTSGNLSPLVRYDREEEVNSEIQILTSRTLAEKVVESLGPEAIFKDLNTKGMEGFNLESALLKFAKALKVEEINKSNVIEVSFKHPNPQMAAKIVNKLVDLYMERHIDIHKRSNSYEFFQEQSHALKRKVEEGEARVQEFKRLHSITVLNEQRSLLLQQETKLRALLEQTLSEEVETASRIAQLRQQLSNIPKSIAQSEDMEHSPLLIDTLQARLVELELEEKELLNKYTEQSRLVHNVRDEIQMVREKLTDLQEIKEYERRSYGPNVTYQRLEEGLFQSKADLEALKAKKETQVAQLASYQKKLEELNGFEVDLNRLQEELRVDRENYRLYLGKLEESRISDAMDIEKIVNVSVIEPAHPPLKPISPNIFLNIMFNILLSGIGAIGLAILLEFLDDRLEKPEDVENYLGLPSLTSIPVLNR